MAVVAQLNTVFSATTEKFERGVDRVTKKIGTVEKAIGSAKAAIAGFLTVATIDRIARSLGEVAERIDGVAKVSDRLGVATEDLLGMQHAAELAGSSAEGMNSGLDKMNKTIGTAVQNGGKAAEVFNKLGLSARVLAEQDAAVAFGQIADALNRLPTHAQRAAAAQAIFGRGAAELTATIALGSKGIAEHIKEVDELGASYSRLEAQAVEAANDAMSRLDKAWEGLKKKTVIQFAPDIEAAANVATAKVSGKPNVESKAFDESSWWNVALGMFGAGGDMIGATAANDIDSVLTKSNIAMNADAPTELEQQENLWKSTWAQTSQAFTDFRQDNSGFFSALDTAHAKFDKFVEDANKLKQVGVLDKLQNDVFNAGASFGEVLDEAGRKLGDGMISGLSDAKSSLFKSITEGGRKLDEARKREDERVKELQVSTLSPVEQFQRTLDELDALRPLLGEDVFERSKLMAFQNAAANLPDPNRRAGALEFGTAEAFSAQQNNQQVQTEQQILAELERQTRLDEEALRVFKESGQIISFPQ